MSETSFLSERDSAGLYLHEAKRRNLLMTFIVDPKLRVVRYILLLLTMIFLFATGKPTYYLPADNYVRIGAAVYLVAILFINIYLLVPKLLFKEKQSAYVAGVLILIFVSFIVVVISDVLLAPYRIVPKENGDLLEGFLGFSFILLVYIAAGTSVRLFKQRIIDNERIDKLGKLTVEAELEQLKNQVNPHFLFNMLNNANVLVHTDPDKASQVLLRLSDLLRYQLYDSVRSSVLLTGEIHFLNDFLDLEKIRRDNFSYIISKEDDISGLQVPPFLFITFVENAVKHNLDAQKPSYVRIYISVIGKKEIQFVCVNSKPKVPVVLKNSGGLGLANVKRRLGLLYGNDHSLTIKQDDISYSVTLRIKI